MKMNKNPMTIGRIVRNVAAGLVFYVAGLPVLVPVVNARLDRRENIEAKHNIENIAEQSLVRKEPIVQKIQEPEVSEPNLSVQSEDIPFVKINYRSNDSTNKLSGAYFPVFPAPAWVPQEPEFPNLNLKDPLEYPFPEPEKPKQNLGKPTPGESYEHKPKFKYKNIFKPKSSPKPISPKKNRSRTPKWQPYEYPFDMGKWKV